MQIHNLEICAEVQHFGKSFTWISEEIATKFSFHTSIYIVSQKAVVLTSVHKHTFNLHSTQHKHGFKEKI